MSSKANKKLTFFILALLIVSCGSIVLAADYFLLRDRVQPSDKLVLDIIPEERVPQVDLDTDTYPIEEDIEEEQEETPKVSDEKAPEIKTENKTEDKTVKNTEEKTEVKPAVTNTAKSYVVKSGDTLYLIAQRLKLDVNSLKAINKLDSDRLLVGQVLITEGTAQKSGNTAQRSEGTQEVASRGSNREDDLYWLSRIIHAESQGEPYEGKVAVGNVILNRVKSSEFPNTVYGVVFDKQFGYTQFSPVLDGSINNTPNAESINAAKAALNGERPVGSALYFLNPSKATNFWIVQNRKYFMKIGDHDFYY